MGLDFNIDKRLMLLIAIILAILIMASGCTTTSNGVICEDYVGENCDIYRECSMNEDTVNMIKIYTEREQNCLLRNSINDNSIKINTGSDK